MVAEKTLITIMVLEPDIIVRVEISEFLRECGYRVIEGVDASDVHAVLEAGTRPDVLLTEVTLNGNINGFELAHEFRQTQPDIVVILVSGVSDVAEKASDLCARGPVKKPYHPEDITRRIRVQLERRKELLHRAVGEKD